MLPCHCGAMPYIDAGGWIVCSNHDCYDDFEAENENEWNNHVKVTLEIIKLAKIKELVEDFLEWYLWADDRNKPWKNYDKLMMLMSEK